MKRFKSFLAMTLALLLALSLTSAAFADSWGGSGPPIVRYVVAERAFEGEAPTTTEETVEIGVPYELNISDKIQLRSEEEIANSISPAVEQKVDEIVSECRAAGVTGEYNTALWLHDWLTHHASYDNTYTIYTPDGVLLQGTGVCQSYRTAYALLLDKVGIENTYISSNSLDHTWNLVKLDGQWCHIDVTWDDPNTGDSKPESGSEGYAYFGLDDTRIRRDHPWLASEAPGVPTASSMQNYYPIRNQDVCYTNAQELDEQLRTKAAEKANPINVYYIGTDTSVNVANDVKNWIGDNGWEFGMSWSSYRGGGYSYEFQISYGAPYERPYAHLDPPVAAPNFTFSGPDGGFALNSYNGSGLILIFGRTTCPNTRALLEDLEPALPTLREYGIEVLVNLDGASSASDLNEMKTQWPDYRYFYGNMNVMWQYLNAAGYDTSNGTQLPAVFVVNRDKMITYYSTGYVSNVNRLLNEVIVSYQEGFIAPAGLDIVEVSAFENANFSSVDLTTANVRMIGSRAFAGNVNLGQVRIPDSVYYIADDAFADCPNVTFVCSDGSYAAQFAQTHGLPRA